MRPNIRFYYDYYQPEAYVPASDTYIEKMRLLTNILNKCAISDEGFVRTAIRLLLKRFRYFMV